MSSVDRLVTLKLRDLNSHSGTSGWSERAIRSGNVTAATPPTNSATKAIGSCQLRSWPRIAPNDSPPTATAMTNAPSQSNRPEAPAWRCSGRWRSVA